MWTRSATSITPRLRCALLCRTTSYCAAHAKRKQCCCDFACPRLPQGDGLLVRVEKEVVRGVRLELGLPHSAGGSGSSSSFGVQSLDEGDVGKELAARGPLLVSD